jgi:hypothetical protein
MPNKFKKLTLQYAYLRLEKEEVDEACLSIEGEIRSYMEKHYCEAYRSIYGPPLEPVSPPIVEPKEEKEIEEEELKEEELKEEQEPAVPKNKDIKTLYRRIAEKTHPDRAGSNDYAELFSQAAEAYAHNDIARLLEIAGVANIELIELSDESLSLLKNNIETISKDIDMKKQTAAWVWYNAESDEQRENIVKNILKHHGIQT